MLPQQEGTHRSNFRTSPCSLALGSVVEFGAAGYVVAWVDQRPPWRRQSKLHGGALRGDLLWFAAGEGRGVFGAFADGAAVRCDDRGGLARPTADCTAALREAI
jgi:hypothetical protein